MAHSDFTGFSPTVNLVQKNAPHLSREALRAIVVVAEAELQERDLKEHPIERTAQLLGRFYEAIA